MKMRVETSCDARVTEVWEVEIAEAVALLSDEDKLELAHKAVIGQDGPPTEFISERAFNEENREIVKVEIRGREVWAA